MPLELADHINQTLMVMRKRLAGKPFQMKDFSREIKKLMAGELDGCPDYIIEHMSWQCTMPDCTCGPWPLQSTCPQCQCRLEAMGFGSSGKGDGKTARMLKRNWKRANAAQRQ